MRAPYFLLLTLVALLGARQSQAQQTPTAPDSARRPAVNVLAQPTSPSPTDVIVLISGDELPARVLRITPEIVRYLAPTTADTLLLAANQVFMIRYANGTKEVLRPTVAVATAPGTSLLGLSAAQRSERGRQDSRQYYKPEKGVFWGTFGATLLATGYGGIVAGTVMSLTPPPRRNLDAPEPDLLNDPAYYSGYRKQAQNRKLGKAAAGFGTGVGVGIAVLVVLLSSTRHF